ncbi:MAG: PQQ-binding-like beta-propeller repeat protein [Nitrososphaerota archaeon]
MKYKINIILIFLLLLNLFIIFPECKENSEHPWPMFKHDPQHTGRVPYPGVQNPILKWEFKAEKAISTSYSSPSISKDGTIYFGTGEFYLYALNPDGTLKWKFKTNDIIISTIVIGPNRIIYCKDWSGYFYAIGEGPTLPFLNIDSSILMIVITTSIILLMILILSILSRGKNK